MSLDLLGQILGEDLVIRLPQRYLLTLYDIWPRVQAQDSKIRKMFLCPVGAYREIAIKCRYNTEMRNQNTHWCKIKPRVLEPEIQLRYRKRLTRLTT